MSVAAVRRVAFVGNHTPRQCGIATFTADVAQAVKGTGVDIQVVAVNDRPEGHDYPDLVTFQVDQENIDSYRNAAVYLNSQNLDAICVQHEYGIYGGVCGSHLLTLLRELHAPIVTTLHTILENPSPDQRRVLAELAQISEKFVVMSQKGKAMLIEVNGIDPSIISVVHHGIPTVEHLSPEPFRERLGLSGKKVILTFGLMAPDKGIENMVKAMPKIVSRHPNAYYLVVGATHPHVRRHSGESYRQGLVDLAVELGVAENIGFVDRFVSIEDLTDYLQAADIYVTPYLKKEQITSGTLAYAFGSGRAVVSTPYWHAEELLADGRGFLVPFRDPDALAKEIDGLLSDPVRLKAVQKRSYNEGLNMIWPVIGQDYVRVFEEALEASRIQLPSLIQSLTSKPEVEVIPHELMLTHLLAMTDDTGILQHATYTVPNRLEGYCTDDNARLAIVGTMLQNEPQHSDIAIVLQHTGLAFLHHAFNPETGRMRNFMSYNRQWLEEFGSEDSHGRALWALGCLSDEGSLSGIRSVARDQFMKALPAVYGFTSPRAWAFSILGLEKMLTSTYCPECLRALGILGSKLNSLYKESSDRNWLWFEDRLAYDNARLPQALLAAGTVLGHDDMIANGKTSLRWLVNLQTDAAGFFMPIGSNGFYVRRGTRATHDQQPLEATATIDACFDAYRITADSFWKTEAQKAFDWFHGENSEGMSLIDEETGGCKDGLEVNGPNHNQGAESTLAYLASTLTMSQMNLVTLGRQNGFLI